MKKRRKIIISLCIIAIFTIILTQITNKNSKSNEVESWVGKYYFSEFAEPNQNMFYDIEIYSSNDELMADIYINGYQTMQRYQAKVEKDGSSINLYLYKYLPDNRFEPYDVGDTLLAFEESGNQLKTYWIKIKPMLVDYPESKTDYFELNK